MPFAARVGDIGSAHPVAFPPSPITGSASKVSIEGKLAARKGDLLAAHTQTVPPFATHGRAISGSSSKVSIEGSLSARLGDGIGCGGSIVSSASKTSIG